MLKLLSGAAALIILSAGAALADVDRIGHGHHGMGGGGWIFGPFMMILFIGLIVAGVVVTFRLIGFEPGSRSGDRSLEILNERFAKGEIDKADYEDRKAALGK